MSFLVICVAILVATSRIIEFFFQDIINTLPLYIILVDLNVKVTY